MKNILIIGAGLCSKHLIDYMVVNAKSNGWFITVGDIDPLSAQKRVEGAQNARAIWLDVTKNQDRKEVISKADLVISLLPAHLHLEVSQDCIRLHKKLVTSSYIEREMYRLGDDVRDASLVFMSEMVLAPGIDRMHGQQKIDEVLEKGGKIKSFKSYSGALVTPECNTNPWNHKITWNPRNFVLSGQGTAQYLEDGKPKYIPYSRLFNQYAKVEVPEVGTFDTYCNRDSLLNKDIYKLGNVQNILRGTLRYEGFCESWSKLVRTGLTDGSYPIHDSNQLTYHDLMEAYISKGNKNSSFKDRVASMLKIEPESEMMEKLEWLGLFKKQAISIASASPALILETLLKEKWMMQDTDRDMIVMMQEIEYTLKSKSHTLKSVMVIEGTDAKDTAISKAVGLPSAVFTKRLLNGDVDEFGVQVPVKKKHYEPVLKELEEHGFISKDYHY